MHFGGSSYKGKALGHEMEQKRPGSPALWLVIQRWFLRAQAGGLIPQSWSCTHRICVGVLCWLPLAPGVATLVLIQFICELCVTRIRLGQQAEGQEAYVTKGETLPKVVTDHPIYFQWWGDIYTLGVAPVPSSPYPFGFSTPNSSLH